ncbi:MAG: DEAD/DEAH box helicase [Nitrospiria bacterium]
MELKDYQRRVLEKFDDYVSVLKAEQEKTAKAVTALKAAKVEIPQGLDDYPGNAWKALTSKGVLPRFRQAQHGLVVPPYVHRHDSIGRSVPHVCLKVPTGGGKTLLAAEGLGRIHTAFFRRQTGLVLWIVPTVQIYRQTWKALANREHPYRQSLERATGGRVKVLEKDDGFNRADFENYLCIMLVRLAATNRANNKDFLKIFRDAGQYTSFFPEVDDYTANNALLNIYKDLETNDIGDNTGLMGISVKHSLVNVLKMLRPVVVIDEGHKAYSENTRASLNGFNPSFVVELTATPNAHHHISNILVDVSGLDLKNEQMIKLPINVINMKKGDWQATLTQAHAKRADLEKDGKRLQAADGRYIRPIMVIRVERTGSDQRDGRRVHALDAKDYLLKKLSVREEYIRIKSSEKDELGSDDLLDPLSPVRYIITKEALQEGWDCPFAYVLALLDKTTASTAMTQMVGRVLRQPETVTTSIQSLNECYVFCFDQDVQTAVENVRKGLEEEGMTGLGDFVKAVGDLSGDTDEISESVKVKRRKKFEGLKIFLPKVLHREEKSWREIHYERDILPEVEWDKLTYDIDLFLDGKDAPSVTTTIIDVEKDEDLAELGQGELRWITGPKQDVVWTDKRLDIGFLSRHLIDVIPNPWQASRIILGTLEKLKNKGITDESLYNNRLFLVESMKLHLKQKVHETSENIFRAKLKKGDLTFRLVTSGDKRLSFEIAKELQVMARKKERKLIKSDGLQIENSLFEFLFEKDFNSLEKDFALCLADDASISWWHRMVARQDYALQGWQRNKVYPDFIACLGDRRMLVLETKGLQFKGNEDTEYKRRLLNLLSEYHETAVTAGEINLKDGLSKSMTLTMLMENDWREKYNKVKEKF